MILIADGGSTKTDWALVDNKGEIIERIFTDGTNPFFQTMDDISKNVADHVLPKIKCHKIDHVYFYGAGCAFPDKNEIVRAGIAKHIDTEIEIGSDLLGAARALCGNEAGIACIIGTGSNSCFYDGSQIVNNVSPLGFILGDEGSGATLGKLLVGACLKNQLGQDLKAKFLNQFDGNPAPILDKVYKQAFPNRFLASLSPFLIQNIADEKIYQLVLNAFKDFFIRNVMQYDYKTTKINFVGSIAYYYKAVLADAATELGLDIGIILKTPMEALVKYHHQQENL